MPTSSHLHRWDGDTLHVGDEGVIVTDRDPANESIHEHKDRQAKLKIREGMRMWLTGFEELHKLPRSIETKKEQGRRQARPGSSTG